MRYQAVIHCEIVRQSARVVAMDSPRLRSGDRACVRFRFMQVSQQRRRGEQRCRRWLRVCVCAVARRNAAPSIPPLVSPPARHTVVTVPSNAAP